MPEAKLAVDNRGGQSSNKRPLGVSRTALRLLGIGVLISLLALPAIRFLQAAWSPPPAHPARTSALASHEILAFAPYWTIQDEASYKLQGLTTVAYFGLDVLGDGSLLHQGPGWAAYESRHLDNLVARAHRSGARVVLTVKSFDPVNLHALASNPSAAGQLTKDLVAAIRDKQMDGANLDFEGTNGRDRIGFTSFAVQVSTRLHAADQRWQVTADTYALSAARIGGFFDVAALARGLDALLVMGYDLCRPNIASAASPLTGPGWTVRATIASYLRLIDPRKVILGLPFYGYDWPTTGPEAAAPTLGPPTSITYARAQSITGRRSWNAASSVPWLAYQAQGSWHQVYYDDATSLALKANEARAHHLRGLGIWALGMEGGDPALVAALQGKVRPTKTAPPSSTQPSSPLAASSCD
jgi:hypothetical protein